MLNKKDPRDFYSPHQPWYYVIQVVVYVFAAGLIADLVQVMNLSVPYGSLQWVLLMMTNFKFLMPVLVMFAVLFRSQKGCNIFWFILITIVWIISVFVVIGLGRYYGEANGPGQLNNLFTSPLYCCAKEIYEVSSNDCPNTGACTCPLPPEPCPPLPTSVSELSARQDAAARFWVDFVYMLYHTAVVVFFIYVFFVPSRLKRRRQPKVKADLDIQKKEVEEQVMKTTASSKMTKDE